ncbi:MAG: bacteriochlorophyll 4-vinyl reductase [Pseudomonadota bacterium]
MASAAEHPHAFPSQSARIGPNAVLQLEQALVETSGESASGRVFARAGLSGLLTDRPTDMVDEQLPRALFDSLFAEFPEPQARRIAHRAGVLTGEYILEHRIPATVRMLLAWLPAGTAQPLLLGAILRHAWTFAGSGRCIATAGRAARIEIAANPLAMPGCAWHVGVFETLFRRLVSPRASVSHGPCCLDGDAACHFEIDVTTSNIRRVSND